MSGKSGFSVFCSQPITDSPAGHDAVEAALSWGGAITQAQVYQNIRMLRERAEKATDPDDLERELHSAIDQMSRWLPSPAAPDEAICAPCLQGAMGSVVNFGQQKVRLLRLKAENAGNVTGAQTAQERLVELAEEALQADGRVVEIHFALLRELMGGTSSAPW